jgi:hypothetical protein
MRSLGALRRFHAQRIGLFATLTMLAAFAPSAHARECSRPNSLGAVLGVPVRALGLIIAANVRQSTLNVLHISRLEPGGFQSQIAIIAIKERNTDGPIGCGPVICKIPRSWLPHVMQINRYTPMVEQIAAGNASAQLAEVRVAQSSRSSRPGSRYLLVPGALVGPLLQLNKNLTVVTRLAIGNDETPVALVNVDLKDVGLLSVPVGASNLLSRINPNVVAVPVLYVGDYAHKEWIKVERSVF